MPVHCIRGNRRSANLERLGKAELAATVCWAAMTLTLSQHISLHEFDLPHTICGIQRFNASDDPVTFLPAKLYLRKGARPRRLGRYRLRQRVAYSNVGLPWSLVTTDSFHSARLIAPQHLRPRRMKRLPTLQGQDLAVRERRRCSSQEMAEFSFLKNPIRKLSGGVDLLPMISTHCLFIAGMRSFAQRCSGGSKCPPKGKTGQPGPAR